ncbi:cytochrome c oxidase copper chaperone [Rhodotorula paludigena]|uniref:cytochrome c oxidase copper chaperone n=1 Tax=Rhodotorula paludigena TaxID=86838 RepID=UPI003180A984
MWPFSSAPAAPSPSTPWHSAPPPPSGPVSFHPTENRPLTGSEAANPQLNPRNPEGFKPCCACPETKKARDDCFLQFGSNQDDGADAGSQCRDIVERHRQCMRSLGFNV